MKVLLYYFYIDLTVLLILYFNANNNLNLCCRVKWNRGKFEDWNLPRDAAETDYK